MYKTFSKQSTNRLRTIPNYILTRPTRAMHMIHIIPDTSNQLMCHISLLANVSCKHLK